MTSLARLMAVVLILVCACGGRQIRWATAAEQSALTTRSFPAHDAVALRRAVVVALRLQGFEVIVTEPTVRTAPKHVMTSSTAFTDQNTAYASTDVQTLAWDVTISSADGTVVVSLLPRYAHGDGRLDREWTYLYLKELTDTLFRLVVESLPTDSSASGAAQ
jgi:hypothetical protein